MYRAFTPTALISVALLAALLGGCSNRAGVFEDKNEGGFFSKKMDLFESPSWARPAASNVALGPSGPVDAADLVGPDGACGPGAPEAQGAAPVSPAPSATAASGAGFDGGLEAGAGGPGTGATAPVLGGIALGMAECDAVRRAGRPNNVVISAGEGGERKVVLTYAEGPWPGIYTFASGRLKEVDAVPELEKPKPAPKKKKPAKRAKSASTAERAYIQ